MKIMCNFTTNCNLKPESTELCSLILLAMHFLFNVFDWFLWLLFFEGFLQSKEYLAFVG